MSEMLAPPAAITAARLKLFAPRCNELVVAPALQKAADRFGIDTPREVRHWMATLHVESMAFTRLEENLNYSAERLCAVWPKRFPTLAAAAPYAHNPHALANKVYGGRGGNTGADDGWLFRGSGPGQLTFRDNFIKAGVALGLDLVGQPDLVRTWPVGGLCVGWFWQARGLSDIVAPDPGERIWATLSQTISENEEDDLRDARQVWNGGFNGLAEVRSQLLRAAAIWRD